MNYDTDELNAFATLAHEAHEILSDDGVIICVLALIWAVYKGFVAYLDFKKAINCKRRNTDD